MEFQLLLPYVCSGFSAAMIGDFSCYAILFAALQDFGMTRVDDECACAHMGMDDFASAMHGHASVC